MVEQPWIKIAMVTNVRGEEVPVQTTDVDGFLAAYAVDGNVFWRVDIGHIQNVLDELIERIEAAIAAIDGLAEQQAMWDDWYLPVLNRLKGVASTT